ncbi:peptide hydrolase [Trypanosoma cruzi]|nr:peptide hydrolase [Trypanosoma cruzi]
MLDLLRQHGAVQVPLALVDENGPSDATLTVATPMTGLRLVSGKIAKLWDDSSLTGHVANLRAPQLPNFENQLIIPYTRGPSGDVEGAEPSFLFFSTRMVVQGEVREGKGNEEQKCGHPNCPETSGGITCRLSCVRLCWAVRDGAPSTIKRCV